MKYPVWNNIIASHFFNPSNAGRDTHLYISKSDIVNLGKPQIKNVTDSEMWNDFILAIKNGLPGSSGNIISKAKYCYERRSLIRIDGEEIKYPLYLSYLAFMVMPLIEQVEGDFNSNNYFSRLNQFLSDNSINQSIDTADFRNNSINDLWLELSKWATVTNNSDLGIFTVKPFVNSHWKYVGKIFSQCVLPPHTYKKIPELFLQAGLVPDSLYTDAEFKKKLIQFGPNYLTSHVLDLIKRSATDELGKSLFEILKREYKKWTGESHGVDDSESSGRIKRNYISSRIFLQFKLFSNSGKIEFSYRIKSSNEFPEDLMFNEMAVIEEKGGISRTLELPFTEPFQLKDTFNKWIASFPEKNARLFISAGLLQLSTDYWIETDTLSKFHWMYILCKTSVRDQIITWGKSHCSKFEDETDYENIPNGYSLYKFLNPVSGIDGIPELVLFDQKAIQLTNSLEFDFRTYTNDFLPEVEILNSSGTESVYIQYKNGGQKVILQRQQQHMSRWQLPDNILPNTDFNVRVEQETYPGNETTYRIITSENSSRLINEEMLPKRDFLGKVISAECEKYVQGSNTIGADLLKQTAYKHLFRGINEEFNTRITKATYEDTPGNVLLSFLTLKQSALVKGFYKSFEFLYSKYYENSLQNIDFNYTKIKKASLSFFDYLGYLDYEYDSNSIVVNPPQFIFIPTDRGRKVLLIGGRDKTLVNEIIELAPKYNLRVEIEKQRSSNRNLLLPDAITIKSYGSSEENYGESNLLKYSEKLKIKFKSEELAQVALQLFCGNIDDYENDVLKNEETEITYEDWAKYIFNPETLRFDKSDSDTFDKNLCLLEYKLRPWEYSHRIWINQKCYQVDRNWARYYVLKKANKRVILKGNNKVAIPTGTPLPRLLYESIMLCSGIAPEVRYIKNNNYRVFENIPSMFIVNLFKKLGQDPVNFEL